MKNNLFSKEYRIQKTKEFSTIFSQGKKFYTKHLRFISMPNCVTYFRLGISIGRRYGKANKRNHFKRLLREAFRTSPFRFVAGIDMVILPSLKEKILDYAILREELNQMMQEMIETLI